MKRLLETYDGQLTGTNFPGTEVDRENIRGSKK